MEAMKFGSLFAGIGGFDLGFINAGMTHAWWLEKDVTCRKVLERRFPGVESFGDIAKVSELPEAEVFAGGFPCQDVSVAGRRAGLTGARSARRSGLFFDYMALVEISRPTWVVIENVPGLLSTNEGRDMGTVLGALADLGYGWAYRVLDARYFGVAQQRRRVFIVGCLRGTAGAAEVLFEPQSSSRHPAARSEAQTSDTRGATRRLASTLQARVRNDAEWAAGGQAVIAATLETRPTDQRLRAESNHLIIDEWVTGIRGEITHTLTSEGADASEDGTGRGTPIITAPRSLGVRRLTPLECERLQGFPDGWTTGESDSARYRMLGNAVCVPVAEWIGRRLIAVKAGKDPDAC